MQSYTELFSTGKILPAKRYEIAIYCGRIARPANQDRYQQVAMQFKNRMPWWVVALIHQMESSFDFTRHLHNGDPLDARTKHVPVGRPLEGNPPFTWEESAADALFHQHADYVKKWDLEGVLDFLERYNGMGYRRHGVNSPYLWSYTTHYTKGRYVADGHFDPEATSKQPGACATLLMLLERKIVELPGL